MQLTPIDEASLERMSEAKLAELLQAHEALYRAKCRDEIVTYVSSIELPGAPPALTEEEKKRLAEKKSNLRRSIRRDTTAFWEEEEFGDDNDTLTSRKVDVAEHHALILEAIKGTVDEVPIHGPLANGMDGAVADGVMIMCPPGSAKSTYASVAAPSYFLGLYSNFDIIGASYASELAKRFGRRVRHLCRTKEYQSIFETGLSEDNQAVDQWSLKNGSSYRSVGIMGGVTGFRADLLLIDDPVAGREEADSDIIREKTWQAFKDDLLTRLKPGGRVVVIQTRWHSDDLSGRILGETWEGQSGLWRGTDGRLWLVLCLPMVSIHDDDPLGRAKGEILWAKKPDGTGWFTERHVELAKATGERSWGALYQQQPSASDGNIILKRHFRCWPHGQPDMTPEQEQNYAAETPPKDIEYVFLTYDTAFEDDEEADYSAMTAWGAFRRTVRTGRKGNDEAKQWNIIMLGAWRAKVDAVDLARMIEEHIKLFKPNEVLIEKRASGIQLLQELRRKRFRHEYGQVAITAWLPPGPPGSKGKRPRAYQSALIMDAGCVWYMPGPKTKAVIKECLAFPNGTYKDWVDCTTMAVLRSRNDFILEVPRDELDDEEQHELEREQLERGRRRGYADTRLKKEGVLVSRPEKGELARRRLYGGM